MQDGYILVTGGAGFIGSHTIVELQEAGYNVLCADNYSNSYPEVINRIEQITNKQVKSVNTDLQSSFETKKLFEEYSNLQGIIHFAAYKSVNESVAEPLKYYQNNLQSLLNLLEQCEKHKIQNFVFSSSCTVYGQPDILPVKETAPIKQPWSPYGNTKKISEEIIQDYCQQNNNFKTIILRYFNPIGAHQSGLIGELPIRIPNNLMPFITQTANGIRKELSVFGNDYDTHDGTAIRDYIHVVDLAKAHVKALERLLLNKLESSSEVFNLGTGKGYSVFDIVNTFMEINKVEIPYKIVDRRAGDIEKIWADPSLANNVLNWKAELTLEDMVSSAWKWEKYYRNQIKKEK